MLLELDLEKNNIEYDEKVIKHLFETISYFSFTEGIIISFRKNPLIMGGSILSDFMDIIGNPSQYQPDKLIGLGLSNIGMNDSCSSLILNSFFKYEEILNNTNILLDLSFNNFTSNNNELIMK